MASKREEAMGRRGERLVARLVRGARTRNRAPFDVVDFGAHVGYEVKTMSALSKDRKVNIRADSMARKVAFAEEYGLEMVLIVVLVIDRNTVEVYSGELKRSVRVSQMERIS